MYTFEIDASAPKADLYAELARAADALTAANPMPLPIWQILRPYFGNFCQT